MKISIVCQPQHQHQATWLDAFAQGLNRHGVKFDYLTEGQDADGDLAVCWGWRIGRRLRERGLNVLVLERGYLGDIETRRAWTSIGLNGLNGGAAPVVRDDGAWRWNTHFSHLMQPWTEREGYALIMGQVSGDVAVAGVDLVNWYDGIIASLRLRGLRQIAFRPHPAAAIEVCPRDCQHLDGDLKSALTGAAFVVTFNSNSGVDAALAGVPIYALDEGSMARPVAAHDLRSKPVRPERDAWAQSLAWRQFTMQEFASGYVWDRVVLP